MTELEQSVAASSRSRRAKAFGSFWRGLLRDREGLIGLCLLGLVVLVALAAPLLADRDALSIAHARGPASTAPSWDYPFGTDKYGRSVLSLIIWGSRVTLTVGIAAALISMLIGTLVGIASGHFRGLLGGTFSRLTEWFLVIPYLPLAIVLATVFPADVPKLVAVIIVIGVTSWSGTARLVRAQTLAIEARPYLERARALGAGHWHQMSRHVLPNVMPLVLANTTLTVALSILAETTLSFFGLGDPDSVSWGTILEQAYGATAVSNGFWWWLGAPGLCVALVVLAFNLCGRAMERVLDPRLRG